MAHEDLMGRLSPDIKKASVPGPFFVKIYPGSRAIVVMTEELITISGRGSDEKRADKWASTLNRAWDRAEKNDAVFLKAFIQKNKII